MGSNAPSPPGNFSYPPQGSSLHFNYIDSMITSWLVFDSDVTDCLLSIWYWPNTNPWLMGSNLTVSANGTDIIGLDVADSTYVGQLNFNYTASDGSTQNFRSPLFNVDRSSQSQAVTWSQGVLTRPTSSTSAALQTSISTSLVSSSALSTPSTTSDRPSSVLHSSATSSPLSISKPSPTNGSDLAPGAIAGIVVGAVVVAGLAAALMFVFYQSKKPHNVQAEVKAEFPASFQSHVPGGFVGEKDGSPLRPNELSGDSQLLEMATNSC